MNEALAPDLAIARADYGDRADAAALVALLDAYARDPMGGGEPLADDVRGTLAEAMAAAPGVFTLLARIDGEAVGLANCVTGFSTFAARPLVNIHDLAVLPERRGAGIGGHLMRAVEAEARRMGACKVTLEVLSGNRSAISLYEAQGFRQYALDPAAGTAQFWEKKLP